MRGMVPQGLAAGWQTAGCREGRWAHWVLGPRSWVLEVRGRMGTGC